MGQKVHPVGFRLGISKDWQAKWYADKQYTDLILEDLKIRKSIASKYAADDVSRVEIERSANQVTVTVHTARPGIVIGRGGQRVDEMRSLLEKVAGKRVKLNIVEVGQPEIDAYLIARSIAQQMERRISHRRAMKQAISRAMERGAQGIKITCSGRLSGSEYARRETLHQGRVPLHTLRADIDYALAEAHTTLGRTGVKVWIYKGDIVPESEKPPIESSLLMTHTDKEEKIAQGTDEQVAQAEAEMQEEPEAQAIASEAESTGQKETVQPESGEEIVKEAKEPARKAEKKEKVKAEKKAKSPEKPKAVATEGKQEKPRAKKKTEDKASSVEKSKKAKTAPEKPKAEKDTATKKDETEGVKKTSKSKGTSD